MNINIHGSNSFNVSNKIKDYISKRIEKINYFKSHIKDINFHLESEKVIYKITATLSINKLGVYKFEATSEEMYTAIDKIIHKIDIKINREKSRIQDHTKLGHEEVVEFFKDHENNNPEPTRNLELINKPTTLIDAYLQMEVDGHDYYGFNLIHEDEKIYPAFLRKLDNEVLYLLKKDKSDSYTEYMLKASEKSVKEDKRIRNITLKQMSLLDAQKDIMEQDYHYNVFLDNNEKINFLLKDGNGKWDLISQS